MRYPFNGYHAVTGTFEDHTQEGGKRSLYAGTDWAMFYEPVFAIEDGYIVSYTADDGAKIISHYSSSDPNRRWEYVHLSWYIDSGYVKEGQLIGTSGATGWVIGPHLHLALILNGQRQDPDLYIKNNLEFTEEEMQEIMQKLTWIQESIDQNKVMTRSLGVPRISVAMNSNTVVEVTRDFDGQIIYRQKKGSKEFSAWASLAGGVTNNDPFVYFDNIENIFRVKARDTDNRIVSATSKDGADWSAYSLDSNK